MGQDPASETMASDGSRALDLTTGHTESLSRTEHTKPTPDAVVSAVPSEQLQAGLIKQTKPPRWSKPTFRIWPGQGKSTGKVPSYSNAPSPKNRILEWLVSLLGRAEDTVDYLRTNLDRMPDKADPVAMAELDAAVQLRRALDEQLEAGTSWSDLVKATIATRARFCAALGGLFALPGTIPGIGTATQFVLGMAATWPEADLMRHQMWCLQVELLHLYGLAYSEADAEQLREGFLNYEWLNKGGEAFARGLLARLHQSMAIATGFLDQFLLKIGASAALRESAGKVLAKTLPLGIGVAIGATVNYLKLHLFAHRQRHRMQDFVDQPSDEFAGPVQPSDQTQVA